MKAVLAEAERFLDNIYRSCGRSGASMSREQLLSLYERVHTVLGMQRLSTAVKKMGHARLLVEVTDACLEAKFSATTTRIKDALLPGYEQFVKLAGTSAICCACYNRFDEEQFTWDDAVREAHKQLLASIKVLAGDLDLLPVSSRADTRTWVAACAILVEIQDEYLRAQYVSKAVAPFSVVLADTGRTLPSAVRFPNKEDMK